MTGAFLQFGFVVFEPENVPIAKALGQHIARVKQFGHRRAAGSIFELLGRVSVQHQ